MAVAVEEAEGEQAPALVAEEQELEAEGEEAMAVAEGLRL